MLLEAFDFYYEIINLIDSGYKGTIDVELSGSRLSGKTLNTMLFLGMLMYKYKVSIISMRQLPKDAKETYQTFKEVSTKIMNFPTKNFNASDRFFKTGTGSLFRFMGYLSNRTKKITKLGILRILDPHIVVRFWDEITEFNDYEPIMFLNQAQGAAPIVINIRTYNPFSPYNYFVRNGIDFFPYNRKTLLKEGQELKSVWLSPTHLKIKHHSNHRINHFLPDTAHEELIALHKINPHRALTADIGLPGIERGAVYGELLQQVNKPPLIIPVDEYRGGVDWGETSAPGGSACVALFGRIGVDNSGVYIDDEYYHSNSKSIEMRTTDKLVRDVAYFFSMQITRYNKLDIMNQGGITVYVDSAAMGIVKALRDAARFLPNSELIDYQPCYKYKIEKRIRVVKHLMGTNRMFINRTQCPMLWSELNQAVYDETKIQEKEVRLKENDDTLDAMEYLINKNLLDFTDRGYNLLYKG